MLLVITRPEMVAGRLRTIEAATIKALMRQSPDLLHLRKPTATLEELAILTRDLNAAERSRIVLHPPRAIFARLRTQEALCGVFSWMRKAGIGRLHLPTWLLQGFGKAHPVETARWLRQPLRFSAAVHSLSEVEHLLQIAGLAARLQYVLVSPLYESISKPGYRQPDREVLNGLWQLPETKKSGFAWIGMGGIQAVHLPVVKAAGFGGAALLGDVWPLLDENSAAAWQAQTLEHFKICKEAWTGYRALR